MKNLLLLSVIFLNFIHHSFASNHFVIEDLGDPNSLASNQPDCFELDETCYLSNLGFKINVNNYEQYEWETGVELPPKLYVRYSIDNYTSSEILLEHFEPTGHGNIYTQTVIIDPIIFDFLCRDNGTSIAYNIELLQRLDDGNFETYPIEAYTGEGELFDCNEFEIACCSNCLPAFAENSFLVCCGHCPESLTGTETLDVNVIQLSPNPCDSYLRINGLSQVSSNINIQIFAPSGRILFHDQAQLQSGSFQLNTKHLHAGIYYCRIQLGQQTYLKKFIKL